MPDEFNEYLFQYGFTQSILQAKLNHNANYIKAIELLQIASIDLSKKQGMYEAFVESITDENNRAKYKEKVILDDKEKIVWLVW